MQQDSVRGRGPHDDSAEARAFRETHAGPHEYQLGSIDDEVWADGLTYAPSTGGVIVETKFVERPGGSSIYEGTAPPFVANEALKNFDYEIERYAKVVANPATPFTRLDVVVSTQKAREVLTARVGPVLALFERHTGQRVPWNITVGGPDR